MKTTGALVALLLLTSLTSLPLYAEHPYADSARAQARRLLAFHTGNDDRAEIAEEVRTLEPIRNPAGGPKLDVVEVWGFVYKGQYRIRLYYAKLGKGDYLLMGQEIVEYARL